MRFYKQRVMHDPENGKYGDCYRTCLASLLDVDPSRIPNFMSRPERPHRKTWRLVNKWLKWRHGLMTVNIPFPVEDGCTAEEKIAAICIMWRDMKLIVSGESPRGFQHSAIYQNGKLLHDPAVLSGGIVAPGEDGLIWVDFLISAAAHEPYTDHLVRLPRRAA